MRDLRFSWPALDGKVGNMTLAFGFGSSLKYACLSTSLAVGRPMGFRESRDDRSCAPDEVRKGNLDRMIVPWLLGSVSFAGLYPGGEGRWREEKEWCWFGI